jgi:hypothetical protein
MQSVYKQIEKEFGSFKGAKKHGNPDQYIQGVIDCKAGLKALSQHPDYVKGYQMQYNFEELSRGIL